MGSEKTLAKHTYCCPDMRLWPRACDVVTNTPGASVTGLAISGKDLEADAVALGSRESELRLGDTGLSSCGCGGGWLLCREARGLEKEEGASTTRLEGRGAGGGGGLLGGGGGGRERGGGASTTRLEGRASEVCFSPTVQLVRQRAGS